MDIKCMIDHKINNKIYLITTCKVIKKKITIIILSQTSVITSI
jgi:hypothetical protein